MVEHGVLPPVTVFWACMEDGERTVVVALPLSSPGFPSVVDEVTVAVLLMVEPARAGGITKTSSVKLALPTANVAIEQFIVPWSPWAGVEHDQPLGADKVLNVVPLGNVSLKETLLAESGPLFLTVIV